MVTSEAGAVVERSDFYPFGALMPGRSMLTGTAAKEKFTGKERDQESGFDYFGALRDVQLSL